MRRKDPAITPLPAIILETDDKSSNEQVRRPGHSDDAIHRAVVWRPPYCSNLFSLRCGPPEFAYSIQGECDLRDTSDQHSSHIIELRQVWYPWHAWFGRRVSVHATLVRRGVAVAHCSSENAYPRRLLELPLWMLDSAVCHKVRPAKPGNVNVESLRELRYLLNLTPGASGELAKDAEHQYLLNAGGADVNVASPGPCSTVAVCLPPLESRDESTMGCSLDRCSTEDCAVAGTTAPASLRLIPHHRSSRGGGR